MIHFLAGIALCIFIGERLVHYRSVLKLRRDARRHLALLYPPPQPVYAPTAVYIPPPGPRPRQQQALPSKPRRPAIETLKLNAFLVACTVMVVVVFRVLLGGRPT
jgi:hypothetical protein